MAFLSSSLCIAPASVRIKNHIVKQFWGPDALPKRFHNGSPSSELELDVYFNYYTDRCNVFLQDGARHISVRTHQHIADIVQQLRTSSTRDVIRQLVPMSVLPDNAKTRDRSIDLAATLLLMIDFGNLPCSYSGQKQLLWNRGSLKEFVSNYFSEPPKLDHKGVRLQKTFTAWNLGRIAGIQIVPTNNLTDHLRMFDDDTKVYIFHHATFLEYQQNSIFPDGLVHETLQTLALLFPKSDPNTAKCFKKLPSFPPIDRHLIECGTLRTDDRQIESFSFWHDRLIMLKQAFDEARPGTLSQWWHDRRNGAQWYTFWVAVLVLALTTFFGFVQCVEGALQVYKTYHPT